MNIFTRIKNNLEYAYHSAQYDKSVSEMKKHVEDDDSQLFKMWALKANRHMLRCLEIPIK